MDTHDTPPHHHKRGIAVIGLWLILSTTPNIYYSLQKGMEIIVSQWATIEWTYITCTVICGIGLVCSKEWARKCAIWICILLFCWSLALSYHFSGPALTYLIHLYAASFDVPVDSMRNIILILLITYMIWPVVSIFFLMHPSVKRQFNAHS